MISNKFQLLVATSGFALLCSTGYAEEAVHEEIGVTTRDQSTTIEEIVVTTQRRGQDLQDVPLAVTAFNADSLHINAINSINELASRTPGLVITSTNVAETAIHIRGIGSNIGSSSSDSAVVAFVDGVYIGRSGGANFNLYDLERIEVLRGPQGTLFGRNVVGGLIHMITAKPTDALEGHVEATVGNYDRVNLSGAISGPLSETLSGRLAFASVERDGYVKNLTTGNDLFDEDSLTARTHLSYKPSDTLEVLLSADVVRDRRKGDPRKVLGEGDEHDISSPDPLKVEAREDGYLERDIFGTSIQVEWSAPFGDLTSITAYRDLEFDVYTDWLGVPVTPTTIGSLNQRDEDSHQFTQELRLASSAFDGRVDWIGGVYYIHENTEYNYFLEQHFDTFTGGVPLGLSGQVVYPQASTTDGYALFADVTWHVTDRLDLIVGGRQSWDEKDVHLQGIDVSQNGLPLLPVPLQAEYDIRAGESWSAFTPRVAASYHLNDQVMVYASASRGFKSGGFQGAPANGISASTPFDPEYAWNYEAGIRSQFLDNRLQINATAFTTDYTNLQVVQLIAGDQLVVGNAADAEITGFELEWTALLTPTLTVSGSYGYLDAEYNEFLGAPNAGGDMSGHTLPRAPDNKVNLTLDYNTPISGDRWRFNARVNWRYTSEFYFDPRNRTFPAGGDVQESYDLIDARLALSAIDERWEVALWGKNLTDELYYSSRPLLPQLNQAFAAFEVPRTYGLSVTWNM